MVWLLKYNLQFCKTLSCTHILMKKMCFVSTTLFMLFWSKCFVYLCMKYIFPHSHVKLKKPWNQELRRAPKSFV